MTAVLEAPAAVDARPVRGEQSAAGARVWGGVGVVLAALILNILDSTIINVAAPSIQRDLAMSASALEWIAAAYTLAIAIGLMTGGRLGDVLGRKPVFVAGLTGFVIASVACAFAWSPTSLIAFRAVQGLSAALMIPQCFGLIRDVVPPAKMGKAFAALGPVIGLSTVLGPVVAGLLLKADVLGSDWRSLFLINVPIGVAALWYGSRILPSIPGRRSLRLDWTGTALMAVVSFLIVFPLVDGRTLGWPVWIFFVLAAAVPVAGVLVVQQRRRAVAGRTGLIETSLLRKRSYVSGIVFTLVFFASVVGFSLAVGVFLQLGLGLSAFQASLYLSGLAVGAFLGSGVGAWAATAVGRPILHIGLAIMAVGTTLLYVSLRSVDGSVGFWNLSPGLTVFGLGMGMIFVPLFSIVIGEIEDHEVGSATGLLESLQQLGASLGVAILATLFFDKFDLEHGGPRAAMAAGRHLTAAEDTLVVALILIGVAFAVGWLLPRRARATH